MKTIDLLYMSVYYDELVCVPVMHDYFGIHNKDHIQLIYGLYVGLIKHMEVPKNIIENCFLTNRLDELIHLRYTERRSDYYREFLEKNIRIGNTYYPDPDSDDEIISLPLINN